MNLAVAAMAAVAIRAPFGAFEIAETAFPERDFAITDFGAKPGGAKCTEAFAAAMDACERAGGGRGGILRRLHGWRDDGEVHRCG